MVDQTLPHQTAVVLIGSGAVKNAWAPVLNALRRSEIFSDVQSPDAANFAMAVFIYKRRQIELAIHDRSVKWRVRRTIKAQIPQFRDRLRRFRTTIADCLKESSSQGELTVRPEFPEVIERFVLRDAAKIALITTNWDKTVDQAALKIDERFRVFHLHGDVDNPNTLYLPTEIVEEPYRTRQEKGDLQYRRRQVMNTIKDSHRLVLYGLGLSPLDAELGQVLASGLNRSQVARIDIIDPEPFPVAERIYGVLDLTEDSGAVEICVTKPEGLSKTDTFRLSTP